MSPKTPAPNASAATSDARGAAASVLRDVLDRRQALDQVLERSQALASLPSRDRAFARLMAATVLRRLGQIDAIIAACLDKPLTPKARAVTQILRLGAAQLVFLDVQPHAAVGETVQLASGPLGLYRGLVNAVLRRVAREGAAIVAAQDAARLNTPDWLWQSWTSAYGEEATRAIAGVHALEPPLDLSVRSDPAAWSERLEAEMLPTGTVRRPRGGSVPDLPGFSDGEWWVQDAAAALPARLFGDVRGLRVLDLCAAPGGKTLQLAAAGAAVTAVDQSPARLRRVEENLARIRLSAELVCADAASWQTRDPFPFVLLDAPCYSTGTIRRHPDVAHLKSPEDVAKLTVAQDRLLDAAIAALAPGGTLVYCVCSLQPEEGPEHIATLLARSPGLTRRAIVPDEIGGLAEAITADGDLRTLPCHWAERGGVDGFYAARLVKEA